MTSPSCLRHSAAALAVTALCLGCADDAAGPKSGAPGPEGPGDLRSFYLESLGEPAAGDGRRERLTDLVAKEPGLSEPTREILAAASFDVGPIAQPVDLAGQGRAALGVLQALQLGTALAEPDSTRRQTLAEVYRLTANRLEYGWFQQKVDAELSDRAMGPARATNSRSMPPRLPRFTATELERLCDLLAATGSPDWAARALGWWVSATGPKDMLSPATAGAWKRLATLESGAAQELDELFYRSAAGDEAQPIESVGAAALGVRGPSRDEMEEIVGLLIGFGLPWEASRYLDDVEGRWSLSGTELRRAAAQSWEDEFAGRAGTFVVPWFVAGVRIEPGMTLEDFRTQLSLSGPRYEAFEKRGEAE